MCLGFLLTGCAMGSAQSKNDKISEEDLQFLLGETSFTKKEIKNWFKGFMDDCPAGLLSRAKFVEIYNEFFPTGNADRFCEHVFRTFDKDNSGTVDFREFLLAINIASCKDARHKLNWAFTMYDIDGNGSIDKREMAEIIQTIYEMFADCVAIEQLDSSLQRTDAIFEQMDTNKDGKLSKKEFTEGCMADPALSKMLLADFEEDE